MKEIPLSKGKVTLVDDLDYEWLNQWKWTFNNKGYAYRQIYKNRTITLVQMHRLILGLTDPKVFCDHIDHDGLNNQRSNLRIATPSQNSSNRKSQKGSGSKYLGVSKFILRRGDKIYSYWHATIMKNGKANHLGHFKIEEDAAKAYDTAAKIIHGDFASLNFK